MKIIKIGGDKSIRLDFVAEDIAWLWKKEKGDLIVLHGASKYRNEIAEKLGVEIKKIVSPSSIESYYSTPEFMEVFLMAYAGLVNKKLVAELIKQGVKAVGLTGVDGRLFLAKRKEFLYVKEDRKIKMLKGDLSGKVYEINKELINLLLEKGYLPVLTVPAISKQGEILNVDNDAVLFELVKAFGPDEVVSLISAPGFLQDVEDERSVIARIEKEKLGKLLSSAKSTMKKKIIYAQKYFEFGLQKMYIGDGRVRNPIKRLLEKGEGTVIF